MLRVDVPTIGDDLAGFDQLFDLWGRLRNVSDDVVFAFGSCGALGHNAVAFLGALIRLIKGRGYAAHLAEGTLAPMVARNLRRNGWLYTFGHEPRRPAGNTIPYREDTLPDARSVSAYLRQAWLGRGWIQVSPLLKSAIVGKVWEVYANAFEHSGAALVTSCGQRYPNSHHLKLTVVDFGIGIPANVRRFHGYAPWPDAEAIEWAFRRGNTTKRGETGRGMGLDLLKDFVRVNNGRLELFSENGYGLITRDREEYQNRSTGFIGTLLNLTLICDAALYYRFTTEPALPPEPLF